MEGNCRMLHLHNRKNEHRTQSLFIYYINNRYVKGIPLRKCHVYSHDFFSKTSMCTTKEQDKK